MSDWVGFTDADLQRMKTGGQSGGAKVIKPLSAGRPKPVSGIGQKPQRKQNIKSGARTTKSHDVPVAAMLSKPQSEPPKTERIVPAPLGTPNDQIPLHGKTYSPVLEATETATNNLLNEKEVSPKEPAMLEDENVIKKKEKIKLEDVHRRQKEMEEKNKRKKTILSKAIAERKKRAFAESTKLVQIQAELAKLDTMLNFDVSILRDKIDEACFEYNNSQKRFERAEAEYISAKICLHKTTEMKEELTEHLYNLIQLNEERKANKLEELMQKLELEETNEVENTTSKPESLKPNSEISEEKVARVENNKIVTETSENTTNKIESVENDKIVTGNTTNEVERSNDQEENL